MSRRGGDLKADKVVRGLINAMRLRWGRSGAPQQADPPPAKARHIPFFQLRDALQEPGCPVCRLAEDAVRSYQRSLLYENVNDSGARAEIAASSGFCHEHAWHLVEYRDVLGVAILHRDLVARFRRELATFQKPDTAELGGRRRPPCPACRVRDEAGSTAITTLTSSFRDPELRKLFDSSDGLCRRHFARASAASRDCREDLERAQRACLDRLIHQLDELIRKHDYRFRHEPVGKERGAWLRAIAAISGADIYMLPRQRSTKLPPVPK